MKKKKNLIHIVLAITFCLGVIGLKNVDVLAAGTATCQDMVHMVAYESEKGTKVEVKQKHGSVSIQGNGVVKMPGYSSVDLGDQSGGGEGESGGNSSESTDVTYHVTETAEGYEVKTEKVKQRTSACVDTLNCSDDTLSAEGGARRVNRSEEYIIQ